MSRRDPTQIISLKKFPGSRFNNVHPSFNKFLNTYYVLGSLIDTENSIKELKETFYMLTHQNYYY